MSNKKIKVGAFLKMLFIKSNLTTKQVALKMGTTPSSLNITLRRNRMNIGTLAEIMAVCEETLCVRLSNGELIELEVDEKKSKNERD